MKRIIAAGFILLMVGLVGAPSFAIETKVTGSLTLDGILNTRDIDGTDSTMAFNEMAVEINTESQINEKIKLFSQTQILDKVISDTDSNVGTNDENDNIQVDKVYMNIVTSIGLLTMGRLEGNTWGTSFYDSGEPVGRIMLLTPIPLGDGKLYVAEVAEKAHEGNEDGDWTTNRDNDKYFMTATYVTKSFRTGLLFGYYPYGTFINSALGLNTTFMNISPYFSGKVGPLMINAEFAHLSGEYDMNSSNALKPIYEAAGASTGGDITTSCAWLEVGYPVGKANIELGYYYMSGDKTSVTAAASDYANVVGAAYATGGAAAAVAAVPTASQFNDIEAAAFFNPGEDWEKVFILTSDDHGIGGNILDKTGDMNQAGMSMLYLSGDFDVTDSFNVYGLFAMATADATATGVDDDYGMEFDLGFNWKIMDNLEYNARAGYLMGGDWFEDVMGQKDLTIMALRHEVVLSF